MLRRSTELVMGPEGTILGLLQSLSIFLLDFHLAFHVQ